MRLNDFIFSIQRQGYLMEAAKDRYMPMIGMLEKFKLHTDSPDEVPFADLVNSTIDQNVEGFASSAAWACQVFNTPQQISWYLKIHRAYTIDSIFTYIDNVAKSGPTNAYRQEYINRLAELRMRSFQRDAPPEDTRSTLFRNGTTVEHFFSQGIPEIDQYDPTGKMAQIVLGDLYYLESEHAKKFANTIRTRKDDPNPPEILIKFPDGSAWFDLNTRSCSAEAQAMGHCGNSASRNSADTVLSYRTPVKGPREEQFWSPHLTFILNQDTGMLGR